MSPFSLRCPSNHNESGRQPQIILNARLRLGPAGGLGLKHVPHRVSGLLLFFGPGRDTRPVTGTAVHPASAEQTLHPCLFRHVVQASMEVYGLDVHSGSIRGGGSWPKFQPRRSLYCLHSTVRTKSNFGRRRGNSRQAPGSASRISSAASFSCLTPTRTFTWTPRAARARAISGLAVPPWT